MNDGSGASQTAADPNKVHCRGTFPESRDLDKSFKRNKPSQFPLGGANHCWTEGLHRMEVCGKAKPTYPAAIPYPPRGAG